MGYKIVLPFIFLLSLATLLYSTLQWNHQDQFTQWMLLHGKTYTRDQHAYRFSIFKDTVRKVEEHNALFEAGEVTYSLAVNAFADITEEEFSALYLNKADMQSKTAYACTGKQPVPKEVPAAFDWSAKSAVSACRDQGTCVSGYAIAAAEAIEGSRFITTSTLRPLSPQQIIDCSQAQGNNGCNGGTPVQAFDYIKRGGIASEANYPYQAATHACTYNLSKKDWEILGCVTLASLAQGSIMAAVHQQPLVVALNADKLKNYSSGVYKNTVTSKCSTTPNTYMLMVGYGSDSKAGKYWKIKSHFGVKWGEIGYLRISSETNSPGVCGVQTELHFPIA